LNHYTLLPFLFYGFDVIMKLMIIILFKIKAINETMEIKQYNEKIALTIIIQNEIIKKGVIQRTMTKNDFLICLIKQNTPFI